MPIQNLSTEVTVTLVIWFIVMFLFAIVFIAGLGSILSEYWTKILSRLKAELKFNSVFTRFTKFFPGWREPRAAAAVGMDE